MIRVQISCTTSAARDAACRGHEWTNPAETAAPVTSAISCWHPLHRDMLEDHQVDGQGTELGPGGQGGIRHARRAGRDMRPAAGAAHLVQVVLDPLRRDLLLLVRPRHPQVSGVRQRPGWSSADGGIEEFPLFRGNTAPAAKT